MSGKNTKGGGPAVLPPVGLDAAYEQNRGVRAPPLPLFQLHVTPEPLLEVDVPVKLFVLLTMAIVVSAAA